MKFSPLVFRGVRWDFTRPLVMGVLNVTPDSFSDGGKFLEFSAALRHADALIEAGADCLDIGAESTRPGGTPVSAQEEIRRLVPVLTALVARTQVPISVDTTKAEVARVAVDAGAQLVNDVSGGLFDDHMFATVDELNVTYICGYVSAPTLEQVHRSCCASGSDVRRGLGQRLLAMPSRMRERVIVDACLGFGKSLACNIELMHGGGKMSEELGRPVLVGASRKRFLGEISGQPLHEREAASVGASLAAVQGGAHMVRVHDVAATRAALAVFRSQASPLSSELLESVPAHSEGPML